MGTTDPSGGPPYYRLNRDFQKNILELITTNFDLNIKKGKKKKGTTFD